MTNEDLNQIRTLLHEEVRAIVREEIAAVREETRAIVREELAAAGERLREEIASSEKRMLERQERAVHALTINLSELRTELSKRMEGLERRFDNLSSSVFRMDAQILGITRTLDMLLKESQEANGTLAGQQKAFDALEARVRALEEKLGGPTQNV